MIIVDTGPLVAIYDPADKLHKMTQKALHNIMEPLSTTEPVLTEAFYMLTPDTMGARNLMDLIAKGGLTISHLTNDRLLRAFELMNIYSDHPMDLADASIIVMAEELKTRKVFTYDIDDFSSYRIKRGHYQDYVEIIR